MWCDTTSSHVSLHQPLSPARASAALEFLDYGDRLRGASLLTGDASDADTDTRRDAEDMVAARALLRAKAAETTATTVEAKTRLAAGSAVVERENTDKQPHGTERQQQQQTTEVQQQQLLAQSSVSTGEEEKRKLARCSYGDVVVDLAMPARPRDMRRFFFTPEELASVG